MYLIKVNINYQRDTLTRYSKKCRNLATNNCFELKVLEYFLWKVNTFYNPNKLLLYSNQKAIFKV